MRLPNASAATVPREKITGYLLSATHRVGRHKAEFFVRFGFRVQAWEALADALRDHATRHEVARMEPSAFGARYIVDGMMVTPDGRNPRVRSVWFIRRGQEAPQFVTAHPLGRRPG